MKTLGQITAAGLALLSTATGATLFFDDFSTDTSSNYTFYKVLDQGSGATNISFPISGGTIRTLSTGTTGAEQALFFHNTSGALDVGQLLVGAFTTGTYTGRNFGIAVGQTPVGLGATAGDTRNQADYFFNAFNLSFTGYNSRGFVGGSEIALDGATFPATADSLYIERTAANEYQLGYFEGPAKTSLRTIAVPDGDALTRFGFYADMRSDGAVIDGFTSLSIIPEPSAAILAALGMLGLLRRRRA